MIGIGGVLGIRVRNQEALVVKLGVPSANHVIEKPVEVVEGGEFGVASAIQVAQERQEVDGVIGVSPTNQVTGEAGTASGEIGPGLADHLIEEAECVGGESEVVSSIQVTGVGGLDGEIRLSSANIEQQGVSGEVSVAYVDQIILKLGSGVTSVNQIIQESENLFDESRVASGSYVKAEAGASGGEISATSLNHETEEAGVPGYEIRTTSVNRETEEAGAFCGEIGVVSVYHVSEEEGVSSGEIRAACSVNHVAGEAEATCSKIELVVSSKVKVEPAIVGGEIEVDSVDKIIDQGGKSGKIEMASANEVNGEPGGGYGEVGGASAMQVNENPEGQVGEVEIASANQMSGEPRGACGESGVPSADQVNLEPGGADGETDVASVNLMNMQLGGNDDKFGVASPNQVNEEPGSRSGEIGLTSANQVNGEPGGAFGFTSASLVEGEPGGRGGEVQVALVNQVNGVSGKVDVELGVREKHRWVDTKFYCRRSKDEKNKGVFSNLTMAPATNTVICNGNGSQNNKTIKVNTRDNNKNDHNGNGVVENEKIVSVPSSGDNAILEQIQPATLGDVIPNKDLSSATMDGITPIPFDLPVTNGAVRPPDSSSDNKVKISLASTAKVELRDLKRKFEFELFSVCNAVKKMDAGGEEVLPEFLHPVVNSSAIPIGARSTGFATRVYSGTRSLGHVPYKPNIRPFNHLRVAVVENGHGMVDSIEREKRMPKANQFYRNSDFLLANDKFPPAESNKKSKSNGKKSSEGEFGFGVGSKVYKSCSTLLEKLMKHKHGWVFNAPVDVNGLGLHDYFLIIKNPMDLGTVRTKLMKFWYKSPMEFAEDVRLTFHNAMMYNPKEHDVHIMAETLLQIFEGKWPDIEVKYIRELRMAVEPDVGYPTPTSRITYPFQSSAFPPIETRVLNRSKSMAHPVNPKPRSLTLAPSFRQPAPKKPKAKDINKRDMTHDEKQKLSTNLQSLPPEKLDGVIQIIKKRSTSLSQNDDEIEVDIDSVDTETLWELDRFVTNYKKNLSKQRRKAELANQMQAEARQAAEKSTMFHSVPRKEATADHGNATLSLPPHRSDPAANASGSSSSSSSGSSSSDSDSDSSSEESDGEHSPGT